MADAADAPVPAATKSPKKRAAAKPKAPAAHPQYKVMIQTAIQTLKERGGSSRQAILKYIAANYKVGDNPTAINARLKAALKAGVIAGNLKQSKGTGAAGSFQLGEKLKVEKKPKKDAVKKTKSPKKAANKPKTAVKKATKSPKKAAKKPASPKKAAKKPASPKKESPKKVSADKPKKPKSPKKTAAAKPKVAKKPADKKPKATKKAAPAKA